MARFPQVGDDFGPYRITGRIGEGGMGVVLAAEQQTLGRTVALKVLAPQLAEQADYRERFVREASVLARLDSPHIIHIYDHGERDGCLFIATQYVAGGDLGQAIRRAGPLPVDRATEIAGQLASALEDAHRAGVVHRDVKPSNVLLRGPGPAGAGAAYQESFAYLCDFGIAQQAQPGITVAGSVAGTLGYLAPERCRGEAATPSSDLYALGCVLWTALLGSAPYVGTDVEVGMQHLGDPVPQLVERDPVSAALNGVLRRSLAKLPSDRYPDAAAMRADLRRLTELARAVGPVVLVPLGRRPVGGPGGFPSAASAPSAMNPPLGPPRPPPRPTPPPVQGGRGSRTALIVAGVLAAVLLVGGGIGGAIALTGNSSGGDDRADDTATSATPSETSSDTPTPTPAPTPTASTPTAATPTPSPTRTPTPTYPDVPAATGPTVQIPGGSLQAPAGWGNIDAGRLTGGAAGARDYSDVEGYYSTVVLSRTKPPFPLTSIDLLESVAEINLSEIKDNPELSVIDTETLKRAWLDGRPAAHVRGSYRNATDGLEFFEESYYVQRGPWLYRLSFTHSRRDSQAQRRAQIDPVVVSFRFR